MAFGDAAPAGQIVVVCPVCRRKGDRESKKLAAEKKRNFSLISPPPPLIFFMNISPCVVAFAVSLSHSLCFFHHHDSAP